jgi:hypothetical protein
MDMRLTFRGNGGYVHARCSKEKKMRGGAHFMVAISLRIFSSGNARRGVNGMRITHFSSVTPSPERKTTVKQML